MTTYRYLLAAALLIFPGLAFAQATVDTSKPWWVWVLEIVGVPLALALSTAIGLLFRKLFRLIDAKWGIHTEEKGMLVVSRVLNAGEQNVRKVISEDLADGKISTEEAETRLTKLGEDAVLVVMDELGIAREAAENLVAAGLRLTGLSSGPKNARGQPVNADGTVKRSPLASAGESGGSPIAHP